jgi:hypothetical protein
MVGEDGGWVGWRGERGGGWRRRREVERRGFQALRSEYTVWCMVYSVWCMVYGVWCIVHSEYAINRLYLQVGKP